MEVKKFVKRILNLHLLFILFSPGGTQFPSRYYQYSSQLKHLQPCPYPGYSADPWNCTRFYRCVDYGTEESSLFLRHDFSCSPGTVFDISLSVCNHPQQVSVGRTGWCQHQVQAELDKLNTPDYYSWDYYEYERQRQLQRRRQQQQQLALRQPLRQRPRPRQQKRLRFQDDEEDDYNAMSSSFMSKRVYLNSEETPQNEIISQRIQKPIVKSPQEVTRSPQDSTEQPDNTTFVYQRRPFYHYQVQIPYIRRNDN